jgi:methylated-DNA-[protein]-cysteine S-methyltransferase
VIWNETTEMDTAEDARCAVPATEFKRSSFDSPLGPLRIRWSAAGVRALAFEDGRSGANAGETDPAARLAPLPATLDRALTDYFAGGTRALEGFRIDPAGTPFQRRVWDALRHVPPGKPLSYGALAAALGMPRAARAVGRAAATNPIALIVPCHRLVGAYGALTGFLWGVARKRWLLAHEAAHMETERHAEKAGRDA